MEPVIKKTVEDQDEIREVEQQEVVETPENTPEEEISKEPGEETKEEVQEEDLVVTIGEETPPQEEEKETPQWVKDLRHDYKETKKQNKELNKQIEELKGGGKEEDLVLGKRPTLEEFDYDEEEYSKKLDSWIEQKDQVKQQELKKEKKAEQQVQELQEVYKTYEEKKAGLKVKDYKEAEDNAVAILSDVQQNILLVSALNPALVVYAIGNNETKAKELSKITDPIKFAAEVARLETTLKISSRKKAPAPETKVKGSGNLSGTVDSTLNKLMKEADKTNDRSKVIAYQRQLRKIKGK